MHCGAGVLVLAVSAAEVSSAFDANGIATESPGANPDVVDDSGMWGFPWSLGAGAPPSLVKCLFATLAGSIFALLGMMVESIRNRKAKVAMSNEAIGKLLPKAKDSQTANGNHKRPRTTQNDNASDSQTPATASRPFSVLRPGRQLTEIEQAERQVKSILNKLTRDKFDMLYAQLCDCCTQRFTGTEDRQEIVDVVARDVFSKATRQHSFIEMYADICFKLHNDLEEARQGNFKRVLLDQCQQSFKTYMEPPKIDTELDYEEQYEELVKYKTKMLGNIRLVGHLLIRRMLSPKIIFHCTDELLSIGTDEALETLCCFVETIGKTFDSPDWKWQPRFQELFTRMELLTENPDQSARLKCLMKDVLDKKRNKWREPPKPKLPVPQTNSRPVSQADLSQCWRSSVTSSPDSGTPQNSKRPSRRESDADASSSWRNRDRDDTILKRSTSDESGAGSCHSSPSGSPHPHSGEARRRSGGKGSGNPSPVSEGGKSFGFTGTAT
jgi:hypothetical protein